MSIDYVSLGKNIRKHRNSADLTQEQLAEVVGCSDRHIGKIENGQNIPSFDVIAAIADALNVGIDRLRHGDQPECTDYFIQELVALTEHFDGKDKLMAIAMVKAIVSIIKEYNMK